MFQDKLFTPFYRLHYIKILCALCALCGEEKRFITTENTEYTEKCKRKK